jgi:uncharacterized protein YdeI (YjbR/CyaY-like superfamily)
MAALEPRDVRFFASAGELRAWLETNHATADELWIGMRPKGSGIPTVTWEEVVDEALSFGWIDSIRKRIEGGSAQRLTPRRAGSNWSLRNIGRVEALRAEGRMRPAGEAAFERRRQDRTGIYSFERTSELEPEAETAIRARPGAWEFWETLPAGHRRLATHWVSSAKRPETRARRLAALADACSNRTRLPQLG